MKLEESLKKHTSFKIGGNCPLLIKPKNQRELIRVLKLLKTRGFKYYIIGNGTNLLVKDSGVNAVIIKLGSKFKQITKEDNVVEALSGVSLTQLNLFLIDNKLSGFEFSSGIPGSVGGAVVMNAGAYGGQISDCLVSAKVFNGKRVITLTNKQIKYGYRKSIFGRRSNFVVISAKFQFKKAFKKDIKQKFEEITEKRRNNHPLNFPSAGSVFKRHKKLITSKTIDELKLKGYSVGGAKISEKHAGFIVNTGGASFEDVMSVITHVKKEIRKRKKVKLKLEVKILGD